jgi:hypothetical protein
MAFWAAPKISNSPLQATRDMRAARALLHWWIQGRAEVGGITLLAARLRTNPQQCLSHHHALWKLFAASCSNLDDFTLRQTLLAILADSGPAAFSWRFRSSLHLYRHLKVQPFQQGVQAGVPPTQLRQVLSKGACNNFISLYRVGYISN